MTTTVIECRDGDSDDDNNYDDDFGFCTLVADVRFKTLWPILDFASINRLWNKDTRSRFYILDPSGRF